MPVLINPYVFSGDVVSLAHSQDAVISGAETGLDAVARFSLTNAGLATKTESGSGTTTLGNWVTPTGSAGAAYEARATVTSGALTSGTTGSWLALSTTREWECYATYTGGVVVETATITVEIRRASDSVVLATATGIVLTATSLP